MAKKRKDRKCVIKVGDLYITGKEYTISLTSDLQDARVFQSHTAAKNSMHTYGYKNLIFNNKISESDVQVVDVQICEINDIKLYNSYYGDPL